MRRRGRHRSAAGRGVRLSAARLPLQTATPIIGRAVPADRPDTGLSADASLGPMESLGATSPPPTTRQAVLLALRREGPLTPEAIARDLGLSRTAILYQLRGLAEAGLVERRSVNHGVGRPRHVYDLTARAQRLLPDDYEGLATSLVEAARDVGGQMLLARIFEARRRAQVARIRARLSDRGLDSAPLFERVQEVAAMQDDLGYLCEAARQGGIRLRERHCPILQVVASLRFPCDAELLMLEEALEADVERETHIASGDRACTYRIRAHGWDSRGWDVSQYLPEERPGRATRVTPAPLVHRPGAGRRAP